MTLVHTLILTRSFYLNSTRKGYGFGPRKGANQFKTKLWLWASEPTLPQRQSYVFLFPVLHVHGSITWCPSHHHRPQKTLFSALLPPAFILKKWFCFALKTRFSYGNFQLNRNILTIRGIKHKMKSKQKPLTAYE